MNSDKLNEIRKRCDQAQEGPWISYFEGVNMECGDSFIKTTKDDIYLKPGASREEHEFIAAARQDIPKLVEELSRLYENNPSIISEKQLLQIKSRCELSSKMPLNYIENSASDNEFIINAREDVLWLLENIKQFH